ncbi:hypothetical protein E1B28_007901 [Marasmius oreades]|uniref:Uncharacterized protein n=1 Tax=Marasmius oreades TaxID=181124 RepID=A0A9P7S384_9AGAR|nr:uncharacterized protein E1B28_007901 [Marasmius oreades]KAG7094300.1 hypothetical protein E1B28_007901 [Marasmius oreades]
MSKKLNKKSKGNGRGRGHETWAKGLKLELLESFKDTFFLDKSVMYSQATSSFIDKWGYDLAPDDMPDPDETYTITDINTFEDGKERANEEAR